MYQTTRKVRQCSRAYCRIGLRILYCALADYSLRTLRRSLQ